MNTLNQLLLLLSIGYYIFNTPIGCHSLSVKNDSPINRPRRRGIFPFWRITGDGAPYEFPCVSIPFQRQWPDDDWPFRKTDFVRIDSLNDGAFYALPRLVYHIDEPAVCALTQHYRRSIDYDSDLLDICSSWASHYPTEFPERMNSIKATGMNNVELFFNDQLTDGFVVADLNGNGFINQPGETTAKGDPFWQYDNESFDVITCALSIDYLIDPVQILRGCNRLLRPGGKVIVSFSNRCFGTKAIRLWRVTGINFHVELVNAFFQYAGNYELPTAYNITPVIPGRNQKYQDPLVVVEAVKKSDGEKDSV